MIGDSMVIVSFGLGNLFSVQRELNLAGTGDAKISSEKEDIENAAPIVLPGVGTFGDGMKNLQERGPVSVLQE